MIYHLLLVEMEGPPLLQSYRCWFESATGEWLRQPIEDSSRIILEQNGELSCETNGMRSELRELAQMDQFFMCIQSFPMTTVARIPFRDGRIVEDGNEWRFEFEDMYAQVCELAKRGFWVNVGDSPAFLPMSTVPLQFQDKPELIVRKIFKCVVVMSDGERPPVVKPIGPFITFDEWRALADDLDASTS